MNKKFPNLRIVLEHVTTEKGVQIVNELSDKVAATITVHHLLTTIDNWIDNPHNYCKPIPKGYNDMKALRKCVIEGNKKFFLGSDSAPHLKLEKEKRPTKAGVFVYPDILPHLATLFNKLQCLKNLQSFASDFGRSFYGLNENNDKVVKLIKNKSIVKRSYVKKVDDTNEIVEIVPFMFGETLDYSIET